MDKFLEQEKMLTQSKIQKIKHLAEGKSGDYRDPKNNLLSVHLSNNMKTLWYNKDIREMEFQGNLDDIYTYKTETYPYDALVDSYLTTVLPTVKVTDDRYEVKWCRDLFISMIREFSLDFNGNQIPQGFNEFLNFELKRDSDWNRISENLGNRKTLREWKKEISSEKISIQLPFCYRRGMNSAFPLRYCGEKNSLLHKIRFNLNIENLLLMRCDGRMVDFDASKVEFSDNEIQRPVLKGVYTIGTESERENLLDKKEILYPLTIPNMVEQHFKTEGEWKLHLRSSDTPVEALYWGAVNDTLTSKFKSLFLCKPDQNSCIERSVFYNNNREVFNLDSFETEKVIPLISFNNTPEESGFSMYRHSALRCEKGNAYVPGLILKDSSMVLKMDSEGFSYTPFVILMESKFIRLLGFPKKLEDRKTMSCEVQYF